MLANLIGSPLLYYGLGAEWVVRVCNTIRRCSGGRGSTGNSSGFFFLICFAGGHSVRATGAIEREVIHFNIVQVHLHTGREGGACWQAAAQELTLAACNNAIDFAIVERNGYVFPGQVWGRIGERKVDEAQTGI